MNKCPECGEYLIKDFGEDYTLEKCNSCGYEKALVPQNKEKQTTLR